MTVQSYNGKLDFGFVADRDLVPDLWVMTDMLHEEMADLVGIARAALEPLVPKTTAPAKKTAPRKKTAPVKKTGRLKDTAQRMPARKR
jgi:hypothetical protein